MNILIATFLALTPGVYPVPPPGPTLDQLCYTPAFTSMHPVECAASTPPPAYNKKDDPII